MTNGAMPAECLPRFATPRARRASHGAALRSTAGQLGLTFMPWQEMVAATALEHSGARLSFRDVGVTVPRQSGKTTLMLAVIVHRMLAASGQRLAYGAQTRLAARGKLFDMLWPMLQASRLRPMFTLTRATGAESLRCSNGSMLTLLSAEESAGHGETLDLVVLDECWAMSAAVEQAARPAMATRPNAQFWMLSTAGNAKSVWWRSKVEGGRVASQSGMGRLAYFEWSAGPDVDVFDQATWPTFMPALGHTIDEDVVAADLAVMDASEWRRAYANQWPDESAEGWDVIEKDVWGASAL